MYNVRILFQDKSAFKLTVKKIEILMERWWLRIEMEFCAHICGIAYASVKVEKQKAIDGAMACKMQYNVEIVANQTILIPKIYPLATFHIHNTNANAAIFPHFAFCSGFLFLLWKIGFFYMYQFFFNCGSFFYQYQDQNDIEFKLYS